MKRAVLLLMLVIPTLAFAQHGGGCGCGTPSTPTMTFQVEASGAENLAIQAEMTKWNRYTDVFRPVAGDSVMAQNGTNEIGFLWGSQSEWIYGDDYYLSEYVYGVTILYPRSSFGTPSFNACPVPAGTNCSGTFAETDIVLNKSTWGGWTASGYPDFDDDHGPASVNATAAHELGHALGLHHNWGNLSTMNYYEDFAGWYVSAADAAAARQHLPARAQATTDVATYPFVYVEHGNGYVSTGTIDTNSTQHVVRGSYIPVSNFTVENVGTANLANVVLRFYLTADKNVTASDYEIGSLSFATLNSLGYFDGAGQWYFRVPESVPEGAYYIGGRVSYDGTQEDTVAYNNAWTSEVMVRVHAAADPLVTITGPTSAATHTTSTETIAISGTGSGSVSSVWWVNTTTGQSNWMSGTTSWSGNVPLALGANEIIVRAYNDNSIYNSDTITITLDNTRPIVTIATPTAQPSMYTSADSLLLGGSATDQETSVASVAWSSHRGGSGAATGTAQWSATVPLLAGANVITITATDLEGKVGKDSVMIHRDTAPPAIAVTGPVSAPAYATSYPAVTLEGQASDDVAISSVAWTNDRGGSGVVSGKEYWSVPVALQIGANVITFTATDVVGRTGTDTITVTRRSDTTPPTIEIPSALAVPLTRPRLIIGGNASDNDTLRGVRWSDSNGGSGWAEGAAQWSARVTLPFGTTIVTFRSVDAAGNESAPASLTIVRKTKGDFGGDGKSELLWRKASTGETTLWTMNKLAVSATNPLPSMPSPWTVNGVDDFDADGKSDVLWRNGSTGQLLLWRMNGAAVVANEPVTANGAPVTLPPSKVIEAVGDFNADARADLLVRDTGTNEARVWLMGGATVVANQYVAAPPMQWSVQGVGDFTGDRKADILWRNGATNEAWAWLMNGAAIAGTGYVASPPSIWSVKGVADFTGDGRSDIVWRNSDTHQVVIWEMYNQYILEPTVNVATPPSIWDIQAVGDFNGDTRADMMWRNTSGQNVLWLMWYGVIYESATITAQPDPGWTVVGPR